MYKFFCSHGSVDLSVDEKAQVLELLPKGTSNEEIENVLTILSQIQCGGSGEEDIGDQEQVRFIPPNMHQQH